MSSAAISTQGRGQRTAELEQCSRANPRTQAVTTKRCHALGVGSWLSVDRRLKRGRAPALSCPASSVPT